LGELVIRDAAEDDLPFLREMLYEASFAIEEPKPPGDSIEQPQIIRYISDWGRPGDRALVAEAGGRPVGAAWYRLFPEADPGYGFVDPSTPELSMAVVAADRGCGVGRALLERLLEVARRDGFEAVSLSVGRANVAARGLYESCGFEIVAIDEAEDGLTMRAAVTD
jgi:ribosomal protein S18 acetylase RimI-like enzyme